MDFIEATKALQEVAGLKNLSKTNIENLHKVINFINQQKKEIDELKKGKRSYAQALKNKPEAAPEHTIIIKAKQNKDVAAVANEVYESIKSIHKTTKNVMINKVIKSKTGAIIKTPQTTNIDELINFFKKQDKLKNSAQVYKPKYLDPLIILKNVQKIQDLVTIPTDLCQINPQLEGMERDIKVLFATKTTTQTHNVYLRVSPQVYQQFVKTNNNLFLNFESIKWSKTVHVRQCQNCLKFNPDHRTKDCTNDPKCKTCGKSGNHSCDNVQRCINCKDHPKFSDNCGHKPNDLQCPIYAREHKKVEEMTCYHTQLNPQ